MRDTKRDTNFGDLNPGGRGIRSQSGSPGAPGHNLPLPLTRFIGRSDQIARIEQQLGENRLLTLTGPGGIGKTRLAGKVAASLARSFDDGVWLVELAPLADSLLVAQAVATVLHVRGLPARPVLESLVDHLRSKQLLLILDNCEHLIDAAAGLVETLLRACPRLRILATSREALGVAGEIMFSVPGLSLPDPSRLPPSSAELIQYEAVQLFMDRAVAIQPNLELTESNARAIAHICHRLGGIPLAIELAAARVNVLNAPEIAARLDDRFALLTDGSRTALARHHTLRAAIDWSYDLLVGPERVLFRRLSAFVGGCTLSAAEYVCSLPDSKTGDKVASPPSAQLRPSEILDLFSNLVNKSLVLVEEQGGETRYQMLETIRHYAREKLLDSGESELVQNRHLDFFLHLAEEVEPKLEGSEAIVWLHRLERENDNFRTALEWSLYEGRSEKGLRLAAALRNYWQLNGYLREAIARLKALLSRGRQAKASVRACALDTAGFISGLLNKMEEATEYFEQALAINRDLDIGSEMASQLTWLGWMAETRGEYTRARTFAEQGLAIARGMGDQWQTAIALLCVAEVACLQGNPAEAETLLTESLGLCRQIGNRWAIGRRLTRLGQFIDASGDHKRAISLIKEGLVTGVQAEDPVGTSWALAALACAAQAQGDTVRAVRLMGAVAALCGEAGGALWFYDRKQFERSVAQAHEQVDAAAFDALWTMGHGMTPAQVIDYALEVRESDGQQAISPQQLTARQVAKKEFGGLTPRERQVAKLIADGKSNHQIAEQLVVSERTVESHVANILNKLKFTARTQIAAWAAEKGLARSE